MQSENSSGFKRRALVRPRIKRVRPVPDGYCFIHVPAADDDMFNMYELLSAYHNKHKVTRNKAASVLRAETLPSLEDLGIIQLEEESQPVREEAQQEQQDALAFRWFIHNGPLCPYGDTNPEDAIAVVKIYREGPVIVCCKPRDIKRAKDFAACCIDLETERKTVKPKILKEEDFE